MSDSPDDTSPSDRTALRQRFMMETPDGKWVVQCRLCPKRLSRRVFKSAFECHEFWRSHIETPLHKQNASPEGREARFAKDLDIEELRARLGF